MDDKIVLKAATGGISHVWFDELQQANKDLADKVMANAINIDDTTDLLQVGGPAIGRTAIMNGVDGLKAVNLEMSRQYPASLPASFFPSTASAPTAKHASRHAKKKNKQIKESKKRNR